MSTNEEVILNKKLDSFAKALTLLRITLGCAFIVGGWVATLEYRSRDLEERAMKASDDVHRFTLWKERTEASRFEAKDGNALSQTFNNRANLQDLRVQKLESGQGEIRKILERIEAKL